MFMGYLCGLNFRLYLSSLFSLALSVFLVFCSVHVDFFCSAYWLDVFSLLVPFICEFASFLHCFA